MFKGTTLRSMLLNAYGWWKVSQITVHRLPHHLRPRAAWPSSARCSPLTLGRRAEITHEAIPSGGQAPAKAA